jgi:tetratricopeptide (TPR) repeat protein
LKWIQIARPHIESALASYDHAIAIKPDFADPYSNRGIAFRELKQLEAALASHDRAGFRPDQPELTSVNGRRNIPLAKLAPLNHPDIEFFSLQKGQPAESELAGLIAGNWDGPPLVDFTGHLHDFSDTAALMEHLDLVISVDTSTAHLAGALGKPVWILNRFDTCWRWLLDRTDSPWYPTVSLYRQQTAGDWDGVVERVRRDLIQLLGARRNETSR